MQNEPFFLYHKYDIPKLGGGGPGVPDLGKIPTFSRFFGGGASLKHFVFVYLQDVQGVRKMCQPKNFLVSPKICTAGEKK